MDVLRPFSPTGRPAAARGPAVSAHGAGEDPSRAGEDDDAACRCCPHLHEAVELIGRRWSGAIIEVLRQDGPLRFSGVVQAIPGLSDRLCSARVKELEARGVIARTVHPGPPVRVEYELTEMGRALSPALLELQAWAQHWLPVTGTPATGASTVSDPGAPPAAADAR
jgi:DNA-binding HxlR family transcriptional regulator